MFLLHSKRDNMLLHHCPARDRCPRAQARPWEGVVFPVTILTLMICRLVSLAGEITQFAV
jgi:hypothetical protein